MGHFVSYIANHNQKYPNKGHGNEGHTSISLFQSNNLNPTRNKGGTGYRYKACTHCRVIICRFGL